MEEYSVSSLIIQFMQTSKNHPNMLEAMTNILDFEFEKASKEELKMKLITLVNLNQVLFTKTSSYLLIPMEIISLKKVSNYFEKLLTFMIKNLINN